MKHFTKLIDSHGTTYNIESTRAITDDDILTIGAIMDHGTTRLRRYDRFAERSVKHPTSYEVCTKKSFKTAWCQNALDILKVVGLDHITRIEKGRFVGHPADKVKYDKQTEALYGHSIPHLNSFDSSPTSNQGVERIPKSDILKYSNAHSLGFDEEYAKYLSEKVFPDRDSTDVELFDIAQANSDHSRHHTFNAILVDEKGVPLTGGKSMFSHIKDTLTDDLKHNSVIAYKDNASAIKGPKEVPMLKHAMLYRKASRMDADIDYTLTAETHNMPTGIAPFQGAHTGVGGRMRDTIAIGQGGLMRASTAGYCVGDIPDLHKPVSKAYTESYPDGRTPIDILTKASDGASDYGNKLGEPIIQGFCRAYGGKKDLEISQKDGPETRTRKVEWRKPIMFSGGIGVMLHQHRDKKAARAGNRVVRLGGPAYRIGMNGGAASSTIQTASTDLESAVQRGDAEMGQKLQRVVKTCVMLGDANPILSIHDQGAGGAANVTQEIAAPNGAFIDIRKFISGDNTLNTKEKWCAEYQEQITVLVDPEHLDLLEKVCKREKLPIADVGYITDTGRIIVVDGSDSPAVDLDLEIVTGDVPRKTLKAYTPHIPKLYKSAKLSFNGNIKGFILKVLEVMDVGSKRFLTNKVDRSVSGLIAQQQCVGPFHTPIADVAVVADTMLEISGVTTGVATAVGEQPLKGWYDPEKMVVMAIGEMLSNLVWAPVTALEDVKCSGNWMWPAREPEEKYLLYQAVKSVNSALKELGIAIDGGKDSMSMSTVTNDRNHPIVDSPRSFVISGYVGCTDVMKVVTPDLKKAGNFLLFIDLAGVNKRLGGSVFLRTLGYDSKNIETPDINVRRLKEYFNKMQTLIKSGVIQSGHDRSDGGLITTLLEMAFAGGLGFNINVYGSDIHQILFNEELGWIVEVDEKDVGAVFSQFKKNCYHLGSIIEERHVRINHNHSVVLDEHLNGDLQMAWESTSAKMQMYKCQSLEKSDQSTAMMCVEEEYQGLLNRVKPEYSPERMEYPRKSGAEVKVISDGARNGAEVKPKVAVIRTEGSNGDEEMRAAFYLAGFDVFDLHMTDLLEAISENPDKDPLTDFNGLAFVGGFSYADVMGSATGWACEIEFTRLKTYLDQFFRRPKTFSLGVCNGYQLMTKIGWLNGVLTDNASRKFESRFSTVKIAHGQGLLAGMEDDILGVWVAHGSGQYVFAEDHFRADLDEQIALQYVDGFNEPTLEYPENPNGSAMGIAGTSCMGGRHLGMMPHLERSFRDFQIPSTRLDTKFSKWFKVFENAYDLCT